MKVQRFTRTLTNIIQTGNKSGEEEPPEETVNLPVHLGDVALWVIGNASWGVLFGDATALVILDLAREPSPVLLYGTSVNSVIQQTRLGWNPFPGFVTKAIPRVIRHLFTTHQFPSYGVWNFIFLLCGVFAYGWGLGRSVLPGSDSLD